MLLSSVPIARALGERGHTAGGLGKPAEAHSALPLFSG